MKLKNEITIVRQHGSHIEVIKVLDNFMVSFTSKNFTISPIMECDIVNSLVSSFDNIMESVKKKLKTKRSQKTHSDTKSKEG